LPFVSILTNLSNEVYFQLGIQARMNSKYIPCLRGEWTESLFASIVATVTDPSRTCRSMWRHTWPARATCASIVTKLLKLPIVCKPTPASSTGPSTGTSSDHHPLSSEFVPERLLFKQLSHHINLHTNKYNECKYEIIRNIM